MPKLTKRLIDSIVAREGDIVVWDDSLAGFGVRVKPSGVKSFCVQYRNAQGRSRRLTIGRYGRLTVDQARTLAKERLGEVDKGNDPVEVKRQERQAVTVKELAQRYLSEHALPKKKTASAFRDERLIERFILPAIGPHKIKTLTRADVAALHHKIGQDTPIQANRTLAVLSKMMTLAISWGLREGENPCRHIERFRERKRERYLSGDELARLGKALNDAEEAGVNPASLNVIRLLVLTGARRDEVLGLRWEWIDWERSCIRLPDSKTGAKVIPLGGPALELLHGLPRHAGNPHVFPGRKLGGRMSDINPAWAKIRASAKLKGVRLHDLRHSFASVGAGSGISLPVIGALLGHSEPATTARYAHLADDPLREAANKIAGQVAAAMSREPEKKLIEITPQDKMTKHST